MPTYRRPLISLQPVRKDGVVFRTCKSVCELIKCLSNLDNDGHDLHDFLIHETYIGGDVITAHPLCYYDPQDDYQSFQAHKMNYPA